MRLERSFLKFSIFIICFSCLIDASLAADKASCAQDKVKICHGKGALMTAVSQSEEIRDHKTFQVAKITIKATPEVVFNTFTDYKRATKIFSHLKHSELIRAEGAKKTIKCEAEIGGGLLKFDYVLEFIEHPPKLVEWHRVSGSFKANEGYWKFEPVDNGNSTYVTYSKYVDGGFLFPQFLVKKELRDNMPVILNELKCAVESNTN